LELYRSHFYQVAITQRSALKRAAIDCYKSLGRDVRDETFLRVQINLQMVIPDAWLFNSQVGIRRTTHAYRKTAGSPGTARHFSAQKLKLDH